ncbi:MAG: GMC family oxidoreductase N-terminal domain-containing protein [Betaproteobacteria bacterium]
MKNNTYDYIIVGAGSAGCALAYRLGADPAVKILVLEAGGRDRSPMIKIPLTWGLILKNRLYDWGYFTQSEGRMAHREIECARGKVIGGSSSINGMAYARGAPEDYDAWAQDFGLTDWSYDKVLPFFKRSENWQEGESSQRGGAGPLHVSRMIYQDPLMEAFLQTTRSLGYPFIEDYNAGCIEGFSHMQTTIHKGKRWSAASAYLYPSIARGNVDVMTHVSVNKVKIKNGRAIGVEVHVKGDTQTFFATQEVILSAGVINSPQLLMLSGVGEAQALKKQDIRVLVDLPGVGKNLHDHLVCDVRWKRVGNGPLFDVLRFDRMVIDLLKTAFWGSGLSGQVPAAAVGHVKSHGSLSLPDLQLILAAAPMTAGPYLKPFVKPYVDAYALKGVFLTPQSRGEVQLSDRNPASKPLILQNFLSHPQDTQVLREMIKIMRHIGSSGAFSEFSGGEMFPGPSISTHEEVDAFIAKHAITLHHPVGTCRMGLESDAWAVLNSNMQVFGVEGLRVVDGSALPRIVRGPVNAPIMMMAEKVSDHILKGR